MFFGPVEALLGVEVGVVEGVILVADLWSGQCASHELSITLVIYLRAFHQSIIIRIIVEAINKNHSFMCVLRPLPLNEPAFGSLGLKREAEEDEIVDMGEGLSFLARLFRMYCPFGLAMVSSGFSLFSSA